MNNVELSPYVNFQGRAWEAMEFYHKVFGGTLDLQTFDEQGVPRPARPGDSIMYARLEADGVILIGVDGRPEFPPTVGDNIALALGGTDRDRLTRIFNNLAEGGTIKMPLTPQSWGADLGYLVDKFGINWAANIPSQM